MKNIIILALIASFAVYSLAGVVDLTPDNFDSVVDGSKHTFVEFFAPWCGHCKRLEPEYEKVGQAFAKINDVVIAKVDADKHKDLASRFEIRGFPTLKWFPKGSTKPEDYNSGREADDIINFINDKAGTRAKTTTVPTVSDVTVLTPSTFDSIVLNKEKHVFVEFYAPWCGHCKKLAPTWDKLATVFKNEPNVVIANLNADSHKDLATKYGVSGFPTILMFTADNKEGEKYEQSRELAELVNYVNQKAGTKRTADGKLDTTYGLVDSLTELAKKFVSDSSSRDATLAEAEKIVAGLTSPSADYYVKFMKAIQKNGDSFVEKESARLQKMLEGSSLQAKKADEFQTRLNILNAFKP